jgi:hypothetical protein
MLQLVPAKRSTASVSQQSQQWAAPVLVADEGPPANYVDDGKRSWDQVLNDFRN